MNPTDLKIGINFRGDMIIKDKTKEEPIIFFNHEREQISKANYSYAQKKTAGVY